MSYLFLPQIYDRLMYESGVSYKKWADHLDKLIKNNRAPGKTLLDLGAGTGELSLKLIAKGYEVSAVDLSAEMLSVYESKARKLGLTAQLYQQDIRELSFHEKQAIVLSSFDTFNYLSSLEEIKTVVEKVYDILLPQGLFIFDLNTEKKLRELYGNEVYPYIEEDFAYIWDNEYIDTERKCTMNITFFHRDSKETFRRTDEEHVQYAYSPDEIGGVLRAAGFELLAVYGDLSEEGPLPESEKHFYICRK